MIQATLLNILPWTCLWRMENAVVLLLSALKMAPFIVLEQRTRSLPLGNVTFMRRDIESVTSWEFVCMYSNPRCGEDTLTDKT